MEKYERKVDFLVYASLWALALGTMTSMTFSALAHVFIFVPVIYYFREYNFKLWSKSQWVLLGLILVMVLSVIVNQDISSRGFAPLTKIKYYLIALLSTLPIQKWYLKLTDEEKVKKVRLLILAFFISTTIASSYGLLRYFYHLNPLHLKFSDANRNTGLFGMVLNFAHNLAFVQLLITFFLLRRVETKKYIGTIFLAVIWIINFVALYTTLSRGALLAFLIAVPFIYVLNSFKKFIAICFAAGILFGIVSTVPALKVIRAGSDLERLSQWKTATKAFEERPILGVGYLNFEQRCSDLKIKYDIDQKQFCGHAHSNYFEMLASTGLIGFIIFLLWHITWAYETVKRSDLLGEITIPLIIVFIISGLTQATFTLGANLFLIMGLYSISKIVIAEKNNEASNL